MKHLPSLQLGAVIMLVFCIGVFLRHGVVSPETTLSSRGAVFQVKQGTSPDGNLVITEFAPTERVAPARMIMNLPRSLRAWSTTSVDGHELIIMVTQLSPRHTFMVRGNFLVTPESVSLGWRENSELMFCGTDQGNHSRWMMIDLSAGSLIPLAISSECSQVEMRQQAQQQRETRS